MEQQQLLDRLENGILQVVGELRIHTMYQPWCKNTMQSAEDILGDLLTDVLELKQKLGIPSALRIVEENHDR